jgi:hypothetical protein
MNNLYRYHNLRVIYALGYLGPYLLFPLVLVRVLDIIVVAISLPNSPGGLECFLVNKWI